jgi:ribonuclease HII
MRVAKYYGLFYTGYMKPHLEFEKKYWKQGKKNLCGIDEVGRGCWAGPLYVGAVVFDEGHGMIKGVNDSKKLTPKKREELYPQIIDSAVAYGVGIVSSDEVDRYGLTDATKIAIGRAIEGLDIDIDILLTDSLGYEQLETIAIMKGDEVCYSISCASIVAKVERDKYISNIPEAKIYQFDRNKGYGTKEHIELLKKHGVSKEHRKSYRPIMELSRG